MSLKGNLATMGLEDLLQWLAVGKKTGILEIKGTTHVKRIAFQDGRVTSVASTNPREYLGQFLVNYGRITEGQLREALAAQEDENQLLGRILVTRQVVTENEIRRIVQLKVEETIFDCFLWDQGNFEFLEGAMPDPKTMLMNLDVTGIVLEGARRRDEWSRIRHIMLGGDAVLAPVPEAIAEQLPLAAEDAEILSKMDSQKTVDHLVLEMRATEFKVSRQLFDLHERGMVRVLRAGGAKPQEPDLGLQRAKSLLERRKLQDAQEELRRVLKGEPSNTGAKAMMQEVQDLMVEKGPEIDLDQIAELAVDLDELTQVNLSPGEAFMATRVTGVHSFRDLMAVAPFDPEECKAIFAKLVKRGILKSNRPASGSGRIGLR